MMRHTEWWITNNDVEEAWWDMITSRILSASEIYQESTSQHEIKKKCCSSFNEWNNIFYENVCYIYICSRIANEKKKKSAEFMKIINRKIPNINTIYKVCNIHVLYINVYNYSSLIFLLQINESSDYYNIRGDLF